MSYVGLDSMEAFIARAKARFGGDDCAEFIVADVERRFDIYFQADVVVNAFNFFELCDLRQAMQNVSAHLRLGGSLFMSTIDKTYLIFALNSDPEIFRDNLRRYEQLPGTKFAFQRIDLGAGLSDSLEYPSVLYSLQDFIDTANDAGLALVQYAEHPFTAEPVPKIYCHLRFRRIA